MIKHKGKKVTNGIKNGKLGKLIDDSFSKKVKPYEDNGFRYPTQVWKFNRDCLKNQFHPTQKPVKLLEELIKTYTNEGDLVLDNCMGSGSTGVACWNLNRNFIGIELDERYFEIAKERIESYRNDVDLNDIF